MAAASKDTIYIDIDDEITAIIDKLRDSNSKVVALVLPKRAATLQSVVNMKLLKRSADESKKNVVLITSEAGLLPLAGMVGLHVAKTLNTKPEIPTAPTTNDDEETVDEEAGLFGTDEPEIDRNQPVGQLAGAAGLGAAALAGDGVETVELPDDELPADQAANAAKVTGAAALAKKPKKDKSLKVPNFDSFRMKLVFGVLVLILLVIGFIFAFKVLPKATIEITTNASNVNVTQDINLSTTATSLDAKENIVPAKQVTQKKTYTQQTDATGQQNNGAKATGKVTISLNDCSQSQVTVPAGTGVSNGGLTYITQQAANLSSVKVGNQCKNSSFPNFSTATVDVVAQSAGEKYNSGSNSYAVANFTGLVSATGTAMSGGTDDIKQVVSQADIDTAKGKINTDDKAVKQSLEDQLSKENLYPITATFSAGTPKVTTSASVGTAANSVTVTEEVTYTMFGVNEDDLNALIDNNVKAQIDTNQQSILSQGLDDATFNVASSTATGAQLTLQTTATVGPELDVDAIKQEAAGKKTNDVKKMLQENSDVKDVTVKYSPFWVTSVPGSTSKINVIIAKPTNTSKSDANNP